MLEQNLRRALSISNGNLPILWESLICKLLLVLAVGVLVVPPIWKRWRRQRLQARSDLS